MDNCTDEYEDWKNWIGQRVCAKGTMIGTLRYFGETSFSRGIWCGIELDDSLGKNDGTVCGVKYFTCKLNHGIFVPVSKVKKLCENSDKIKEIPYRANQNKTFEIKGSHKFSIETNKVDEELACNNAAVESIDKTKFNLSKSLMDSEESLGILHSEEFESSWDSLLPDYSLSNLFPSHQVDVNYIQDFDISQQCIDFEKGNIFSDKISYPKYASTPRQVMKTKSVGHVNDLKANLCLDIQEDADLVFSDVFVQNNSNVFFDFDKIKDNPNLSSTSKTQLNLDFQIHNDEQNLTATESKILMGNEENNLNTTRTFSKPNMNYIMENDPLNKTFALTPDSCSSINEFKELQNKEIINKQVNENCDKKFNCTFNKEDLSLIKELNLNATYELKAPEFSSQNYLHEKTILADNLFDNLNTFNTSNSIDQNVADTELFDSVQIEKKYVSESCSVKDKLTSTLLNNKNSDFNQKVEIPDIVFDDVLLCEEPEAKIPSNSSNEQNTIKQDGCTSDKASKKNFLKKSFLYKNKSLKDVDKIEKTSRKSISSHLNTRKSLSIPDSSGTLLLNSTFCLKNEKSNSEKAVSHRSRKSLSEATTSKTSVHEKFNDFKKPFVPHSLKRPSKFASKSQPFMDSKTKGNLQNSSSKESCNSRNSFDKSNFALVKGNDKSLLDMKSKLPVNSRSLKLPVKTDTHLSRNLNVPKNALNTTIVLPLCKENKCTSRELYSTHPGNTQSKFDSKGILNSKNIYSKNRDVGNCREGNSSNNSKIVTQKSGHKVSNEHEQFKIPDLLNANKTKLSKRFQTVSLSTEDVNPRRNTISSYSTESLPVGIVKPRSSLSKPIKFINEKSVSQNKDISVASDNIVDTKSKIKRVFGSRKIQVPRNFKTDTSKRNS